MNKILLLGLTLFAASCGDKIEVSGHREDVERDLSGFHSISVGSGIRTVINHMDKDYVSVKTFTSVQKYVKTVIVNEVLYVELEANTDFDNDPNIVVTIAADALREVTLNSGVKATSDTESFADSDHFILALSGGSTFTGDIICRQMDATLSDGSTMKLTGNAQELALVSSGGANADCRSFSADIFSTVLSGGSICDITVNDRINKATLSGGSRLTYRGTRIVNNASVTGGSELISKN
ncbi:MAG: DUF2807 domain-containing protein [Rikenellaceae bacterium]